MSDDRNEFENYYLRFKQSLEVLAASPEEACELLGHYNVAFETKSDLGYGVNLFSLSSCPFTSEQRQNIVVLLEALETLPDSVLGFTDVPSESLERMKHPAWVPLRDAAARLLVELQPVSSANERYFGKGAA